MHSKARTNIHGFSYLYRFRCSLLRGVVMSKLLRPIIVVANIIVRKSDKAVLIGKRLGNLIPGVYAMPGGKLEYLETFEGCASRETLEEVGIKISPKRIRIWTIENTVFPEHKKHFVVIFAVSVWTPKLGKPVNKEPSKCESWEWCQWDKLPRPLAPGIMQILDKGMRPIELCK